ncbi:MAG: hypothetical protein R3C03_21795 [Pirellulaceae bacterium]
MERAYEHLKQLYSFEPQFIAADLHPGYMSRKWAEDLAQQKGLPLVSVQHHHAHVAGLMAEHRVDEPVIGVCFDGTGYGTDGTIWGGEWLLTSPTGFERCAHLETMPLPGGDACVKSPARIALAYLWSVGLEWDTDLLSVQEFKVSERKLLLQQLEKNINCVLTSSMGRLFDAVASLCDIRHRVSYEGQAAIELEALARRKKGELLHEPEPFSFGISGDDIAHVELSRMFVELLAALSDGQSQDEIALKFHVTIANMIADVCEIVRQRNNVNLVGLTGGVFQNILLTELATSELVRRDFTVLVHHKLPPNDGGLALGQLYVARQQLRG